ncbi:MAG: hypothetical protein R2798_10715, partial [Chitinophagales bacterium]
MPKGNLRLSYNLSIQKQYHSFDSVSTNYIQTLGRNINFNLSPSFNWIPIGARRQYEFTLKV